MHDLPLTLALDLELDGPWLTVWFNEPDQRNPLSEARSHDLHTICAFLRDRREIRGVTFRGRGGIFCAGGDLKEFRSVFQGEADRNATLAMSRAAGSMFDDINSLPQLTVMAVEGFCVAGGMGLACSGDVVIAERDTRFSLTEIMIGLTPAQIAPFIIQRLGFRMARRLMLTAASFKGDEAVKIGLADQSVEGAPGMDEAIAAVRGQALRCAPGAVAVTKDLLLTLPSLERPAQIEMAAEAFTERMMSKEGREGIASFVAKRKPDWTGA